jgi:hypothetical protein
MYNDGQKVAPFAPFLVFLFGFIGNTYDEMYCFMVAPKDPYSLIQAARLQCLSPRFPVLAAPLEQGQCAEIPVVEADGAQLLPLLELPRGEVLQERLLSGSPPKARASLR